MRHRVLTSALAGLTSVLVVAACGAVGGAGSTAAASGAPSPTPPWLIYNSGNPSLVASPTPDWAVSSSGLPWTPLPSATSCDVAWPTDQQVFIPLIVTPGVGSLTVKWPSAYGPTYRVTAVDQKLVTGAQPTPTWITVQAGTGCSVTATLTGLKSGNPYVVWLDAPDTPRKVDNSRSLYSGRSSIVKPN